MTFPSGIQPGSGFGAAFIDLLLRNRTREGIDDAMQQISRDSDKITKEAGKSLGDSLGESMSDEMEKPSFIKRLKDALVRGFRRNRTKIPIDADFEIDQDALRRSSRTISRQATSLVETVGGAFSGGLRSLGASFGNVGSAGPFSAVLGLVAVTIIPALIGAVAALLNVFAPLLNIILLLPAAIAVLGAAIFPLIVAFQGLGTAIGAVLSGDPEAIEEAFKGISKSAREVVSELGPLRKWFSDFKTFTQEAFFSQLPGVITILQKELGPTFITGFQRVARAAGLAFAGLVVFAENPSVKRFFDLLFSTTANVFDRLGPTIIKFLIALSDLGIVSLPYVEKGFAAIAGWVDKLSNWLTEISNNGEFKVFMDELGQALRDLKDLGASGWNLIKAIVGGADEQGGAEGFLATLGATLDALTVFFESDAGRAAIRGWITLAEVFLVALGAILFALALIGLAIESVGQFFLSLIAYAQRFADLIERIMVRLGLLDARAKNTFASGAVAAARRVIAGFAEGGIVNSPTLATLGEDYRREVVIPLENPARAQQLAQQSGLTSMLNSSNGGGVNIVFGAGAIQVNFTGALPTQEQAEETGAAVGAGISGQLARRNVRLAVRTQ